MFELLPEMPLPAKFFVAFVVVLALIALTAWLVRRLGANRLGGSATRGRQPRLAVIDAASVDGRRRLVLIRRDNIEHLLMIGGPTDVVVEQNIVRASGASRDVGRAAAPGDNLPRTMPLGDNNGWPLQPSVEIAPAPAMPPAPAPMQPQAPLRATRITPTDDTWAPPPEPPRARAPQAMPPVPPAPQPDPSARFSAPDLNIPPPPPLPEPAAVEPTLPIAEPTHPPQSDRNLAEMAQRLEAALRRPAADTKPVEPRAAAPDPFSVPVPSSPRAPEPPRAAPRDSAVSGEKTASSSKTPFDNLEQEMANLLGRPANKT